MKIKEVIEQTGLTDKAIRLYINNGLVAPSIEENYSGRKSIEFSDTDVERLKNIALLRKAGFSIADIKETLSDENNVVKVVNRFIEEKEKDIQRDTEIVNMLKNVSDEKLTFESLCEALSETTIEKDVPAEDMHVFTMERVLKKICLVFGFIGLTFSVGVVVCCCCVNMSAHKFFQLEEGWLAANLYAYSGSLITAALSVYLIVLCLTKKMIKKSKIKQCILFVSILLLLLPTAFHSFLVTVFTVDETTSSTTTDIDDYGDFDYWAKEILYFTDTYWLFPYLVPYDATDAKYYYCYSIGGGDDFQSTYANLQIYAEWILPEEEYEAEKHKKTYEKYKTEEIWTTDGIVEHEKKVEPVRRGDWTCYYFEDDMTRLEWEGDSYLHAIFAYNDETRSVRYVVCYASIADVRPYCYFLEW